MATPFEKIYPVARTLLGDVGRKNLYANSTLDLGIRRGLLEEEVFTETTAEAASGDRLISPDIATKTDLLRVSVRCALALVAPTVAVKSYKSPVLSVSRDNRELVTQLTNLLKSITDGDIVVDGETDLDTYIYGQDRYNQKMSGI